MVLNGDIENQVCTDHEDMGSHFAVRMYYSEISWEYSDLLLEILDIRTEGIRKIELYFREPYAEALFLLDDLEITWEPARVWKGDRNLATITTGPGNRLQTSNLFDSNINSVWYPIVSHGQKSIAVTFTQPILFTDLIIFKPTLTLPPYFENSFKGQYFNNYRNVCLFLDDRKVKCTDVDYGFSEDSEDSDTITWSIANCYNTNCNNYLNNNVNRYGYYIMAKKVELVFNNYGRAKIAEMEIIYYPTIRVA